MSSKSFDWLKTLDVQQARHNLGVEFRGDWFRDPWAWPEFRWLTEGTGLEALVRHLDGTALYRGYALDVPKENFGIRPACILDPLDRITYQCLVDHLAVRLAGDLPDFVCGWRLPRDDPAPGHYANNAYEWGNYRSHLIEFASRFEYALATDVVSFFESIDVDRLGELIERTARRSRPRDRLLELISQFEVATDRSGLPQRSLASALLANAYLRPIDDLLLTASRPVARVSRRPTHSAVRWMDDVWLFGNDEGALRHSQVALEDVARAIVLTLNSGKTRILTGEELEAEARQREHSAVAFSLTQSAGTDLDALADLVARMLQSPETTPRTTYRFVLARIEEFGLKTQLKELLEVAHRAPHAADSLADAARRLHLWQEMTEWFLEYRQSQWALDLSCAHLARMFPTNAALPCDALADAFEEDGLSASLPRMTVALVRLSGWRPESARMVIREALHKAEHPFLRRTLAFIGLHLSEERALIRKTLRTHAENAETLKMTEARDFQPFKMYAFF